MVYVDGYKTVYITTFRDTAAGNTVVYLHTSDDDPSAPMLDATDDVIELEYCPRHFPEQKFDTTRQIFNQVVTEVAFSSTPSLFVPLHISQVSKGDVIVISDAENHRYYAVVEKAGEYLRVIILAPFDSGTEYALPGKVVGITSNMTILGPTRPITLTIQSTKSYVDAKMQELP